MSLTKCSKCQSKAVRSYAMQSWLVILRCSLTIPRIGWLSLSAIGRLPVIGKINLGQERLERTAFPKPRRTQFPVPL